MDTKTTSLTSSVFGLGSAEFLEKALDYRAGGVVSLGVGNTYFETNDPFYESLNALVSRAVEEEVPLELWMVHQSPAALISLALKVLELDEFERANPQDPPKRGGKYHIHGEGTYSGPLERSDLDSVLDRHVNNFGWSTRRFVELDKRCSQLKAAGKNIGGERRYGAPKRPALFVANGPMYAGNYSSGTSSELNSGRVIQLHEDEYKDIVGDFRRTFQNRGCLDCVEDLPSDWESHARWRLRELIRSQGENYKGWLLPPGYTYC